MPAYYNEIDPYAAQWLRNLIAAGHIAPGVVDERSIEDVHPSDLRGFKQCHFFAGIGVWSLALRRGGWPDDRPIWTGSAPCQPFSAAGSGAGTSDERHLWPVFARLIEACRPEIVMGEQVSSLLITGRQGDEGVQRLWERKARLGILADWLEEDIPISLQGVPQQDRKSLASDAEGINCDQSIQARRSGEVESVDERTGVFSDRRLGADSAGHRCMRSNWNCIRPHGEQIMEHAVLGPDTSWGGVHPREHAGGLVRLERSLRQLGREQNDPDEPRDHGAPQRAIQRASEETDREIEARNGAAWVDTLQIDLEGMGYAFGCVPFPSAGVGAPHIRDRLYWVAHSDGGAGRKGRAHVRGRTDGGDAQPWTGSGCCSVLGGLANSSGKGLEGRERGRKRSDPQRATAERGGAACRLEHAGQHDDAGQGPATCAGQPQADRSTDQSCGPGVPLGGLGQSDHRGCISTGLSTERFIGSDQPCTAGHGEAGGDDATTTGCGGRAESAALGPGPTNGRWAAADWLLCRDGKWRPVEPGTFPLVDGAPSRVGRLRAYGNAINAQAAETFIRCVMPDL